MITVFTPTYNRKKTLIRLYNSLLNQTYSDFEWLIVDDGSNDDTDEIVREWMKEKKINIKYHYKNNGGKHRAINKGLQLAKGELFFIVDSDDYLTENALERINFYYEDIKDNYEFIGVTGFRQFENGKINGKFFPNKITDSNLIERREKYGNSADMAHVIKTKDFKKYLFPDIPGENFVAESIVWNRMCIDYKMRYFNEAIYVGEYLEEGLTYNSVRNRRKNNQYSTLLYKELAYNPVANFKTKFKAFINFWRFGFCKASMNTLYKEIGINIKSLLALPIGFILFVKDTIKYK